MPHPIERSDAEWRAELALKNTEPLAYAVTRQAHTEPPFSGRHLRPRPDGLYRCICCAHPLFDANTQFDAGCGWPSFWQTQGQATQELPDHSHGMHRTEVKCRQCGAHLGHVFPDGPPPTGLRYCMNSAALEWVKQPQSGHTPASASAAPQSVNQSGS